MNKNERKYIQYFRSGLPSTIKLLFYQPGMAWRVLLSFQGQAQALQRGNNRRHIFRIETVKR